MKLTEQYRQEIVEMFKNNLTLNEIRDITLVSISTIKRTLAEEGLMTLHWHKTREENLMLTYLRSRGINSTSELMKELP